MLLTGPDNGVLSLIKAVHSTKKLPLRHTTSKLRQKLIIIVPGYRKNVLPGLRILNLVLMIIYK